MLLNVMSWLLASQGAEWKISSCSKLTCKSAVRIFCPEWLIWGSLEAALSLCLLLFSLSEERLYLVRVEFSTTKPHWLRVCYPELYNYFLRHPFILTSLKYYVIYLILDSIFGLFIFDLKKWTSDSSDFFFRT